MLYIKSVNLYLLNTCEAAGWVWDVDQQLYVNGTFLPRDHAIHHSAGTYFNEYYWDWYWGYNELDLMYYLRGSYHGVLIAMLILVVVAGIMDTFFGKESTLVLGEKMQNVRERLEQVAAEQRHKAVRLVLQDDKNDDSRDAPRESLSGFSGGGGSADVGLMQALEERGIPYHKLLEFENEDLLHDLLRGPFKTSEPPFTSSERVKIILNIRKMKFFAACDVDGLVEGGAGLAPLNEVGTRASARQYLPGHQSEGAARRHPSTSSHSNQSFTMERSMQRQIDNDTSNLAI